MRSKIFFLFVFIALLAVFFAWYKLQLLPVSNQTAAFDFVIEQGQSLSTIAENLKKQGLIRSPLAFKIMAIRLGLANKLQSGYYKLSPSLSSSQIALSLTHGTFDVRLTFPEGQRIEEIASRLQSELGIPTDEFLSFAEEGYMFPDTYFIPRSADGRQIAQMMLDNFNRRVDHVLIQDAQKRGLSLKEVVILASMIEREVKAEEDRPIVAGILIKRWRLSLPLEVDATVQYALGYQEAERSWWKKTLTVKDLAIDSPYNTRKYKGLPPAPIANPGLSAIKAVIYFQDSPYLYYLSDNQGKIHYAQDLQGHINNIGKFGVY